MKFLPVLLCIVAFACAESQTETAEVKTEVDSNPRQQIFLDEDGHFLLRLEDMDGTVLEEEGVIVPNEETGTQDVVVKMGTYYYPTEDGKMEKVSYDVEKPHEEIEPPSQ